MKRYRHAFFIHEQNVFLHGGFEPEFPNKPLDTLNAIDISSMCYIFPKL